MLLEVLEEVKVDVGPGLCGLVSGSDDDHLFCRLCDCLGACRLGIYHRDTCHLCSGLFHVPYPGLSGDPGLFHGRHRISC